jgi:beta-phosphoglucomutase-like phosphatase (HAD superfamily)
VAVSALSNVLVNDPALREQLINAKEETLVVEDSSRGLTSAVASGIDCAIVYNDFTREHGFSAASYRIAALIELKDIILKVI